MSQSCFDNLEVGDEVITKEGRHLIVTIVDRYNRGRGYMYVFMEPAGPKDPYKVECCVETEGPWFRATVASVIKKKS